MADGAPSGGFIEWLSAQWFLLLALVTGAGHAARSQAKIGQMESELARLSQVKERLAVIETNVAWIKEHLERGA